MSRRLWYARDAQLTADPKVQVLGHDHGPAGVLVLEEVFSLVKINGSEDATIDTTFAVLGSRAFTSPAKARAAVARADELGLVAVSRADNKSVTLGVPKWSRWQIADPTAADRQARRRANGNVTAKSRGRHA